MRKKGSSSISFLQLCMEIFYEKYGENSDKDPRHFYNTQLENFREIILAAGIDVELLKNGAFEIPVSQKEYVKSLLNEFTSKPMKKFRKKNFDQLQFDELKPIVQKIDALLSSGIENSAKIRERSKMYVDTRYLVNEAITEVRSKAIEQAILDMESMRPILTDNDYYLNDSDRAYLIRYYGQLLSDTSAIWHKIVSIVSDLREQEILSISEEELVDEPSINENIDEYLPLAIEDIQSVVLEAISILREEEQLRFNALIARPRFDDLKRIKDLISQIREKRDIKS